MHSGEGEGSPRDASRETDGILLAGGRSSRMGFDKLSAKLGGEALILRPYGALRSVCRSVLVVGGDPGLAPAGSQHVPDASGPYRGPLVGLASGLEHAGSPVVVALAGDLPFVGADLLRELVARVSGGALAAVPVHPASSAGEPRNLHPLCAAYRTEETRACAREALEAGERSMRSLIHRLSRLGRVEYVSRELERFGDPDVFLMNVNTPEDLLRAERLSGRTSLGTCAW
ncbi:molybdenum cofactor guanylyltransferase [Rubrobacter radiotolerans]|uniref:Probable molybdenum cofactor guanylyltransferase n=1 Tax=Rubrobacter radiotolerans TaxID=42256 RepID=A0AB35T2F9_RUBRA|nr:molybdenum cofactor guanylyltransferase [Rubrobacter radiotolerans]MDX5893924.1 molybdenum cofactor guanylyltransferase [Rubrobacter radiotolerans]